MSHHARLFPEYNIPTRRRFFPFKKVNILAPHSSYPARPAGCEGDRGRRGGKRNSVPRRSSLISGMSDVGTEREGGNRPLLITRTRIKKVFFGMALALDEDAFLPWPYLNVTSSMKEIFNSITKISPFLRHRRRRVESFTREAVKSREGV